MTGPKPQSRLTRDFEGYPVDIGDSVIYTHIIDTQRRGLRRGIVIEIVPNFTAEMYRVFDIDDRQAAPYMLGKKEIMFENSDYRGLSIDYILSLHGVEKIKHA